MFSLFNVNPCIQISGTKFCTHNDPDAESNENIFSFYLYRTIQCRPGGMPIKNIMLLDIRGIFSKLRYKDIHTQTEVACLNSLNIKES